jgi:4-hydroxy-3-methylbut-2-enyl diphosphate reductase
MDNQRPATSTLEDPGPTQGSPDPQGQKDASEAQEAAGNESMEALMAQQEAMEESFASGTFLTGKVVAIDSEGVLVDVGYKSEGRIPLAQLSHRRDISPQEALKVGDQVDVVVQRVDEEGSLILSKKRADLEAAWRRVLKAYETGETITATCTEQVKGGLIVDLGLRGFVPASHVDLRPVHDLSDYVGEVLPLKVLEVDRNRRKVVLSRKKAIEEERQRQKEATLAELVEGTVVTGTVARLTKFGAFINLGGVDGLVHLSELSWKRINDPHEVVRVGEKVDVLVLKVDKKKERISLSLRQARPDPWLTIEERFHEGQVVTGRVSRLAKNYAFVELEEGLEGLVPVGEISDRRISRPEDALRPGQEVQAKILEIRRDSRRILLSIRQALGVGDYRAPREESGGFSIGDILKSKLAAGSEMRERLSEAGVDEETARKIEREAGGGQRVLRLERPERRPEPPRSEPPPAAPAAQPGSQAAPAGQAPRLEPAADPRPAPATSARLEAGPAASGEPAPGGAAEEPRQP